MENKLNTEELRKLSLVFSTKYEDYHDSTQTNERWDFLKYTSEFFEWLDMMYKKDRIKDLLELPNYKQEIH